VNPFVLLSTSTKKLIKLVLQYSHNMEIKLQRHFVEHMLNNRDLKNRCFMPVFWTCMDAFRLIIFIMLVKYMKFISSS
jgi:hypothetical protein